MKNMMKKLLMAATGVCLGAALFMAVPEKTYAYPCTVDAINTAKAQKAAAEAELLAAQNNKAAADALVAAAKANGASQLELTQATDAAATAENLIRAAVDKVNNAQAYIDNATNRLYWEDEYIAVMGKWNNQVTVDQARYAADFAQKEANNAAMLLEQTTKNIASQSLLAAGNPAIQAQVDAMNAALPGLTADAAAKAAIAADKAAAAKTLEQTLDRKWDSGEDWYYDHMVLK